MFNHEGLRRELRALGHRVHGHGHREVVVHAAEAWGPWCVERVRGPFAFALWDTSRRRLLVARDGVGMTRTARQALIAPRRARGILSVSRDVPLPLSEMGQRVGGKPGDDPIAEDLSDRRLRRPVDTALAEGEPTRVIDAIRGCSAV
jgi:hypothetical protein